MSQVTRFENWQDVEVSCGLRSGALLGDRITITNILYFYQLICFYMYMYINTGMSSILFSYDV